MYSIAKRHIVGLVRDIGFYFIFSNWSHVLPLFIQLFIATYIVSHYAWNSEIMISFPQSLLFEKT